MHQRRVVYIKKDFQRRFIVKFCLVAAAAMVAASALVYFFSADTLTASYRYSRLSLQSTSDAMLPILLAANGAVLVGFLFASVYVTLYVSHKIAGPLYRFERDLEVVAKGDLTKRIGLRQGDELQEFAGALNQLTQSQREKIQGVKDELARLADPDAGRSPADWARELAELGARLDREFKTS